VIPVSDTDVTNPTERKRLGKQGQMVLDAFLTHGVLLTSDLKDMRIDYSARIAECRNVGWDIECYHRDKETGQNYYRLNNPDEPALKPFTVPARIWGGGMNQEVYLDVYAASWTHAKNLVRYRTVNVRAIEDLHENNETEEDE
jgi:hypothetical protein